MDRVHIFEGCLCPERDVLHHKLSLDRKSKIQLHSEAFSPSGAYMKLMKKLLISLFFSFGWEETGWRTYDCEQADSLHIKYANCRGLEKVDGWQ